MKDRYLSKNFTLHEAILYGKYGKKNIPDSEELENMEWICESGLQVIRDWVGVLKVNSVLRKPYVNNLVGGVSNSHHLTGCAADIESPNYFNIMLFSRILYMDKHGLFPKEWVGFDQIALEKVDGFGNDKNMGWIHISFAPRGKPELNRRQVLLLGCKNILLDEPFKTKALAYAKKIGVTPNFKEKDIPSLDDFMTQESYQIINYEKSTPK